MISRQSTDERPMLSEFSIAILSMLCLSMGIGSSLPRDVGLLSGCAGFIGLIAYGVCMSRRRGEQVVLSQESQKRVEARLTTHAVGGVWRTCSDSVASLFDSIRGR
jgi:hypothetical protein